jgi:hypothetical protein
MLCSLVDGGQIGNLDWCWVILLRYIAENISVTFHNEQRPQSVELAID